MKLTPGFAVAIGRLNPIHAGHETVTTHMIRDRQDDCMEILGSINKPLSFRHMFSYQERVNFIKQIFPTLNIQGLPDYPTNEEWFFALDQLIRSRYAGPLEDVVFYGGCEEDLSILSESGRKCRIVNRFDGISSPKVSATEVRDHLLRGEILKDRDYTKRALEGLINPLIQDELIDLFSQKLAMLKKI